MEVVIDFVIVVTTGTDSVIGVLFTTTTDGVLNTSVIVVKMMVVDSVGIDVTYDTVFDEEIDGAKYKTDDGIVDDITDDIIVEIVVEIVVDGIIDKTIKEEEDVADVGKEDKRVIMVELTGIGGTVSLYVDDKVVNSTELIEVLDVTSVVNLLTVDDDVDKNIKVDIAGAIDEVDE